MQIKIGKIFFSFRDNGIWIGSVKLSLLTEGNTCHRQSIC